MYSTCLLVLNFSFCTSSYTFIRWTASLSRQFLAVKFPAFFSVAMAATTMPMPASPVKTSTDRYSRVFYLNIFPALLLLFHSFLFWFYLVWKHSVYQNWLVIFTFSVTNNWSVLPLALSHVTVLCSSLRWDAVGTYGWGLGKNGMMAFIFNLLVKVFSGVAFRLMVEPIIWETHVCSIVCLQGP